MPLAARSNSIDRLSALVRELEALPGAITGDQILRILGRSQLDAQDVAPFITPTPETYSRRRVARTDAFEMLVMTWLPGQGAGAHDHAGSVSAFKILRGTAQETRFVQAADSLVDSVATCELQTGEVGLDAGDLIHSVHNGAASKELLVSIHVYAPPMPELRRFTRRPERAILAAPFQRHRAPSTPVVAIVGGGFSGAMVAMQLVRKAAHSNEPVHIVVIDRQTSIAEGAAYRTPDPSHLLNVPASDMSAWPDRPDDLLAWAKHRDPLAGSYTFLQRQSYGEYLRATLFETIAQAGSQTSVALRRGEAAAIERRHGQGWVVHCGDDGSIDADIVVLATGHRAPADPLKQRWAGSRARYIEDPWAALALTSIEPDESVCLLGTGLTAIDVLQRLTRSPRTAPVLAVSRRGLVPACHAPVPKPSIDPRQWLEPLLGRGSALTIGAVTRSIRDAIRRAEAAGHDWRQVIDGLRPHISRIGNALPPHEMNRFLHHARAFWEVTRHRMAPAVAEVVGEAGRAGLFSTAAGRIVSGRGARDGVSLTVRRRGASLPETLSFDWIINCTGPGSGRDVGFPPVIAGLIDAGHLEEDPFGLGVRSTAEGGALADGRVTGGLLVIGSMRKADTWESTAVPELRLQAALAADAVLHQITSSARPSA